jgi:hypothetical protein
MEPIKYISLIKDNDAHPMFIATEMIEYIHMEEKVKIRLKTGYNMYFPKNVPNHYAVSKYLISSGVVGEVFNLDIPGDSRQECTEIEQCKLVNEHNLKSIMDRTHEVD